MTTNLRKDAKALLDALHFCATKGDALDLLLPFVERSEAAARADERERCAGVCRDYAESLEEMPRDASVAAECSLLIQLPPVAIEKLPTTPSAETVRDGWISCTERLPENDVEVLVSFWASGKVGSERMTLISYRGESHEHGNFWHHTDDFGDMEMYEPTHWQPLPAPPALAASQAEGK